MQSQNRTRETQESVRTSQEDVRKTQENVRESCYMCKFTRKMYGPFQKLKEKRTIDHRICADLCAVYTVK